MEMSENIAALSTALATAQATLGGAVKDKANPAFKSKYADLGSVWDAWQLVGPAQGLSVVQLPGAFADGKATLTTILSHKSGEWIRETLSIPVTKADAQGYGSALTYARRYALASFVGVCPEDDDGNGAVRGSGGPRLVSSGTGELVSKSQLATLQGVASAGGADLAKFCTWMKVESLADIPASQFERAQHALASKVKAS